MAFNINEYPLKDIVSLNPDFIKEMELEANIEGTEYLFKLDYVMPTAAEFVYYARYTEINSLLGPIEKKLKDYTYGKQFNDFNDYELYELRNNTKFTAEIDGNSYKFEVSGAGPVALKVSLVILFKNIETSNNPLENDLKTRIINTYIKLIENNKNYQEKLENMKEENEKYAREQQKIDEEIRKEEEEKERKRKELEKILNSNKPKNNNPFKF